MRTCCPARATGPEPCSGTVYVSPEGVVMLFLEVAQPVVTDKNANRTTETVAGNRIISGSSSGASLFAAGHLALPRLRPALPLRMEGQSGRGSFVSSILSHKTAFDDEAFTQIQTERGVIVAASKRPSILAQASQAVPQECPT